MERLVKQIYLKMMIQPRAGCYHYVYPICPSKEDADALLKCLVDRNAEGIAGMIFINPKYALHLKG